MTQRPLVGIDIGGTKIRLGYSMPTRPHELHYTVTIPTPRSFRLAQPQIAQAIEVLLDGQSPGAIGVCSPGPIDPARGTIGHPTNLHWRKAPIVEWLQKSYGCRALLLNDTAAAGVCEAQVGSGRRTRLCLYVSISTGIGSALLFDGWPLPGPHNAEGGRMILGTSMQDSNWQDMSSGTAIVRTYGRIAALIKRKDDWKAIAELLAVGLHNLIVATDPEIVILGGGVSLHHKKFLPYVKRSIQRTHPLYPLPPIRPAKHIEHAPLIGAILACTKQRQS